MPVAHQPQRSPASIRAPSVPRTPASDEHIGQNIHAMIVSDIDLRESRIESVHDAVPCPA